MALTDFEQGYLNNYAKAKTYGDKLNTLYQANADATANLTMANNANMSIEEIANNKFKALFPNYGTLESISKKLRDTGSSFRHEIDTKIQVINQGAVSFDKLLQTVQVYFPNNDGGNQTVENFLTVTKSARSDLTEDVNKITRAIDTYNSIGNYLITQGIDINKAIQITEQLNTSSGAKLDAEAGYDIRFRYTIHPNSKVWQAFYALKGAQPILTNIQEYANSNIEKENIANGNQALITLFRNANYDGEAFYNNYKNQLTDDDKKRYSGITNAENKLTGIASSLSDIQPEANNAITQANMFKFNREDAMKNLQRADVRQKLYTGTKPSLNTGI